MYAAWKSMKDRCSNPASRNFKHYGGKGVIFDPRWSLYVNFYADMGERPAGTSLDRIDTDGPYCKGNCRWASLDVKMNNRTDNVFIEHEGRRQTASQWAREAGLSRSTVLNRFRAGYPPHEFLRPVHRGKQPR